MLPGLILAALCVPLPAQDSSLDACRQLVAVQPDDLESYRCFWKVASRSLIWQEAEQALREMLDEAPHEPRIQLYLGAVLASQGKPEAQAFFEQAADGFATGGNARGECFALISLTAELNRRGRLDEGWTLVQRAKRVAGPSGDEELVARVSLGEGWHLIARGEFDQAAEALHRAEMTATPASPFDLRYHTTEARAFLDWSTGRYRRSAALYRECLAMAREQQDLRLATSAAYNTLLAAARLRAGEVSIEHLQSLYAEVIEAAVASGNTHLEANARTSLGQPFDGDPERRRQVEEALLAARRSEDPAMELTALRGLAQHDACSGPSRWPAARAQAELALELAKTRNDFDSVIRGQLVLGEVLDRTNDRDGAFVAWHQAIDEIEALHQRQISEETASRIASRWSFAYYDLIGQVLQRSQSGDPEPEDLVEALTVMERLRGHTRGELFHQSGARGVELPPSNLALSLARIRGVLAPEEALLSFQLSTREKGGSWAVLVSREVATAIPLQDRQTVDAAIELMVAALEESQPILGDALNRLTSLVVTPALDRLPPHTTRLVIVPDGNLFTVPFAALRPGGIRFLVESHILEIVPSLLDWLEWREHPSAKVAPAVLGFADPAFRVPRPAAAATEAQRSQEVGSSHPPLPGSRRELRKVCALVGNDSIWLSDYDATEASLQSAAPAAMPILHFATHTVVDSENPQNTAVLLAPRTDSDDGRLTIADVLDLDHGAQLVILNSCRSAGGVVLQGRGVWGLTQGFLTSGARTVIGNLWSVDDRASTKLVTALYRELIKGTPVAEALARAQRWRIQKNDHPSVWAALVANGDGALGFAPATTDGVLPGTAAAVGALALVAVLVGWASTRRRRVDHRRAPPAP